MPFNTSPDSFGNKIVGQLHCFYSTPEQFDALQGAGSLANVLGPDLEILVVEITPSNGATKRTFFTDERSPVSKLARWVQSWQAQGREFDGANPTTHDGEWAIINLKQVSMGKRGSHEVWEYGGVPAPDEIGVAQKPAAKSSSMPTKTPVPDAAPASGQPTQGDVEIAILASSGVKVAELGKTLADYFGQAIPVTLISAARMALVTSHRIKLAGGVIMAVEE